MKTISTSATVCRWTARIVSALVLGLILVIAIGEHMPISRLATNLVSHPLSTEALGFAGFSLMMLGLLAGWRWEIAGGIASLVGVAALVEPTIVNGRVTWFFALMAAPGALYIASHRLRHHLAKKSKACGPEGPVES